MSSPFPGMDPYLETPRHWLDFHNALATEIRSLLNQCLGPSYAAWLDSYAAYETVEVARLHGIRPNVSVWETASRAESSAGVVAIAPAPITGSVPVEAPARLFRVEVRTTAEDQLVTAIEILSPANKRSGHDDGLEYRRKRRALLGSSTHLMEIDLLRGGDRPPLTEPVIGAGAMATTPADDSARDAVKHLVQAYGGSIAVESRINRGSAFQIRLKLEERTGTGRLGAPIWPPGSPTQEMERTVP